LETAKLALEGRKLEQEVRSIELQVETDQRRFESESAQRRLGTIREWTSLGLTFATVISVAVALVVQLGDFLERSRKSYEVDMSEKFVALVDKLHAGGPAAEDAAILLSAYEDDAVPVLIQVLRRAENPEPVIDSLRLILAKKRVHEGQVLDPLFAAADFEFVSPPTGEPRAEMNLVQALGRLGSARSEQALERLNAFAQRAVVGNAFELSGFNRFALCQELNVACSSLSNVTCASLEKRSCDDFM